MRKHFLIVFLTFFTHQIIAQNCIDYGEFDDPTCLCAPSGWDQLIGNSEIDDVTSLGGCSTDYESPTGGTFAAFNVGTIFEEGIETTIDGLTPGSNFSIGFWWFYCDLFDAAELIIEIDGTSYVFDAESDWSIASVCFEAESESADVVVYAQTLGTSSYVLVDDIECIDLESCCPLTVELEEELEICPLQDLLVDATIDMESGNVTYIWTSDPPEGTNYLDDVNIEDPIFNFDENDIPFDGITFDFILTVEDEACKVLDEISITVFPLEEISTDIETDRYCEMDGEFIFPTFSNEGYSGQWDTPSIELSDYGGQSFENTFTIDDGQLDCPYSIDIEIFIDSQVFPEFDLQIFFCDFEGEFIFPDISENNIQGSWVDERIYPIDLSPDDYTNTFIPDNDFCISEFTIEYEIHESIEPRFSLKDTLCQQDEVFTLPTESNNNIDGLWTPTSVDPSMIEDSLVCIFTSDEDDCIQEYRHVFHISNNTLATFNLIDTICVSDPAIIFENTSIEGHIGQWNIPSFLPDTITSNSLEIYWVSATTEDCLDTVFETIIINELTVPEFNLPTNLCNSDNVFTFLNTSLNGVEGTWTESSFIPSNIGSGTFENTFTPNDNLCSQNLEISILVTDAITPEFNLPTALCESDNVYFFPTITNQNTTGVWEFEFIDPDGMGGETVTNTFINTDINNECIQATTEFDIVIESVEIPSFDIPTSLCFQDSEFNLPLESINLISGSWNITSINPNEYNNEIIDLTFVPDEDECFESYTTFLFIIGEFEGQVNSTDASDCNINDGSINLITTRNDLEFSIDNGINWQSDLVFTSLNSGSYDVLVRNINYPDCVQTQTVKINSPMLPLIETIMATPNTSCESGNGAIEIIMATADFEFSIDGGITWQESNVFSDLDVGEYIITVRDLVSPDCVVVGSSEILDNLGVQIDLIMFDNPSDCGSDATIRIFASGPSLLYSIDGGTTWSADNFFSDLNAGQYDVIVTSTELTDCFDEDKVFISNPEQSQIIDVIVTNLKPCSGELGTIEILVQTPDEVQYSIDGGETWFSESLFIDLEPGNYIILTQYLGYSPNCHSREWPIEIIEENIDIISQINISTTDPIDCNSNDGSIDIGISNNEFEFSIDNGANWQMSSVFGNLNPGSYTIIIRSLLDINCQEELMSIIINNVDCPCSDLSFDFFKLDILCSDENNGKITLNNILGFESQLNGILWGDGQIGTSADNLDDGWHSFEINYDNDCIYQDSVFIDRIDPLSFFLESFDTSCGEDNNGSIAIVDISGGSGVYDYALNSNNFQDDPVFFNLSPGEFEAIVIDSAGCLKSEFIDILEGGSINLELPEIMTLEQGESTFLNPLIEESSIDSFTWTSDQVLISNSNLALEIMPVESTEFTLTIYYGNCTETRTILINVNTENTLYLGNVFTPNEDGNNDVFYIQSSETNSLAIESFKIYDRWGNLVFNKTNPLINNEIDGWDGYINNVKGIDGVYVYFIEFITDNSRDIQVGSVTLIR